MYACAPTAGTGRYPIGPISQDSSFQTSRTDVARLHARDSTNGLFVRSLPLACG
jgi:hypothetical protein